MYVKNQSLATPIDLEKLNLSEFIVIDLRSRGYFLISHIKEAINVESLQRIAFIAQENTEKKDSALLSSRSYSCRSRQYACRNGIPQYLLCR